MSTEALTESAEAVPVIEADDSCVTHWPCGTVLPTRFDGEAVPCPRCGRLC